MKQLFLIITLFYSISLKAQLYIEFSGGYAFPMENKQLPFPYYKYNHEIFYSSNKSLIEQATKSSKKSVKMNLATGYHYNGNIGFYFNKYIGLSLSYNYNDTKNDSDKKISTYDDKIYYDNVLYFRTYQKFNFYSINKSYILNSIIQYPLKNKLSIFMKLGMGYSNHIVYTNRNSYDYNFTTPHNILTNHYSSKEKYYGNYSISKIASLGVKYNVFNNLWLSTECSFTFENYKPIKLYAYDISSTSSNTTADSHEITLQDEEQDGSPILSIDERSKNVFAYSIISINVGIQYVLNFIKKETITKEPKSE